MNCKIIATPHFVRELKRLAKRYKSMREDYARLLDSLRGDPMQGADLGGGVHKVRLAIASKGKGKRGGARVITFILSLSDNNTKVRLLSIYDKAERETITPAEIARLVREVEEED